MGTVRDEISEIVTGLALFGFRDLERALAARPRFITNVDDAVYDRLDIPRLTEQQISLRFERALGILDTLSVEKSRTERMREYALSLMGRKN